MSGKTRIYVLDIGGTKVTGHAVETGSSRDDIRFVGQELNFGDVVNTDEIVDGIADTITVHDRAVVIACAGKILDGTVIESPNAPYLNDANLGQRVRAKIGGRPCFVGNDMHIAAPGMHYLDGSKPGCIAVATWSSGFGGKKILDGKVLDPNGEYGHMVVKTGPRARKCGDGHRGHAEAYIGGTVVSAQIKRTQAWRDGPGKLEPMAQPKPLAFLDDAYKDGYIWAARKYGEIADAMGALLTNMAADLPYSRFLWKGTFASHALKLPGVEKMIRNAIVRYAWSDSLSEVPFVLTTDMAVPNADTYIGGAIIATEVLGY